MFGLFNFSNITNYTNETDEINLSLIDSASSDLQHSVDETDENTSNMEITEESVNGKSFTEPIGAEKQLKDILSDNELEKISLSLQNLTAHEMADVIIELDERDDIIKDKLANPNESRDKKLLFAKANSAELADIVKEEKVKKVWPDLPTRSFLNSSTQQIDADNLWDLNLTGTGIKIAILDTGIDAGHEMLSGRVVVQEDFTGDGFIDSFGHGTHCAGIAAGNGFYRGVAYNATIYNGKVLDDSGYGQLSWLINGIDWAMENDVDVISLSLGAPYSISPEEQLNSPEVTKIEEAVANGIVVVIASGNCGGGCGGFFGVTTPGIARNAITVGAVDRDNEWASFSSGAQISDYIKPDVVAPGVGICSSIPGGYDCYSGTSMATPHVAGAAALLLEKNVSVDGIKQILENSALDLGDDGKDIYYGSGLIDLTAALGVEPVVDNISYYIFARNISVGNDGMIGVQYQSSNETVEVLVMMTLQDLDETILYEEEASIQPFSTHEFTMHWTPTVSGKYPVKIEMYENSELMYVSDKQVYASGQQNAMMSPVRLVVR